MQMMNRMMKRYNVLPGAPDLISQTQLDEMNFWESQRGKTALI